MRFFAAISLAFLSVSCTSAEQDLPPPAPALWEVTSRDGKVEGWLFGTIHSLPDGMDWRTKMFDDVAARSDVLLVEVANLDDAQAMGSVFSELSVTSGLPPLDQRVPPANRAALDMLLAKGNYRSGDFTATESWAAALMLAQIARIGDAENGVDRNIIRAFGGRRIAELEGVRAQLAIFDALPEREQRDLLLKVVEEAGGDEQADQRLAKSWRKGDLEPIVDESEQGLLADPELREALLTKRNLDWAARIAAAARAEPTFLVAVGAAHLVGPEGLPSLIEQRGYTVTRIQ